MPSQALARDPDANTVRFTLPASAFVDGRAIVGIAQVPAPGTAALVLLALGCFAAPVRGWRRSTGGSDSARAGGR